MQNSFLLSFGSANPKELGDEIARYKGKYNAKSWID